MKVVISQGKQSYQVELKNPELLFGKRIGDSFKGTIFGIPGLEDYEFLITGGSTKDGFPMKKGLHGTVKKRLLLSKGVGYKPKGSKKKVRKKKMVRGEVIADDIAQVNTKVIKEGAKKLEEIFGEKKEEAK